LRLLKKTKEFGEQANLLEGDYQQLYEENSEDALLQLGLQSLTSSMRQEKPAGHPQIEFAGIKMPKLDLTKIYAGREMQTLALIK